MRERARRDDDDDDDEVERESPIDRRDSSPELATSLADGLLVRDPSSRTIRDLGSARQDERRTSTSSFAEQLRYSRFEPRSDAAAKSSVQRPSSASSFVVPSADVDLPRDETDVFISSLQIRMTRNVVIEAREGAEAALLDQQNLLKFYAEAVSQLTDQEGGFDIAALDVIRSRSLTNVRCFTAA